MKTYQVGFSVRVSCGDDLSAHRIEVPVEAPSAESAAKQLADALEVIVSAERRAGERPTSAAVPKGAGKP